METAKGHTVIVVNDDPTQLRLVSGLLEKDGLNVLSCRSVEEALRVMNNRSPVDAIVTDLYMPGIDGWRFCRLLRSPEYLSFNKTPILVVSATFSGADAAQVTADLGANAFLSVPCEPSALQSHVRDLLEGRVPRMLINLLILMGDEGKSRILRHAFEAHGYNVHTALTTREARGVFQKCPPDVAIIDCHLSDSTGEQLIEEFKRSHSSTVILLILSDHNSENALQLMKKGADGYVRNPFDPDYLVLLCEKVRREQSLMRIEKLLEERTLKLRQSEEKYRLLLSSIPDIVIVHDANGNILHINEVGATRLEWPVADLIGKNLSSFVLPNNFKQVAAHVSQAVTEGSCRFETTYISRSGKRVEAEINERPIEFEGKQAILSVGRDISKRKRAEERRTLLATAIEQTSDIVIIAGTDRKIQYVNPAFEKVSGYTRNEVIGQNLRILKSAKHDKTFYRKVWDIIQKGDVWTGHLINKKKDGSFYEVDAAVTPIRNASGDIVNYVAVNRDVTQEVSIEEQLRQSQKLEELGALAGGVAHDFNNLLTGILGYVSILKSDAEYGDDVFQAADVIEKAAQRAAELTDQLLGFARRGKHRNIPVDMHKLIEDVVKLLSRTIEKNISVLQELKVDYPYVLGDPGQMEQVILNLAINARDAMPEGGKLIFATNVVELDELCCRTHPGTTPGRYLLVSITDTGCGIHKEVMERIFEPFFTTKEQGKGTGMGLAMVYGIVKNHGGSIQVYSESECGTTFKLYLPLASDLATPEVKDFKDSPVSGTGRILVVDDEEIVRKTATELLSRLGYEVVTASDGQKAVDYYKKFGHEIDLVILDMVMPRLGGRDCFRALKTINPNVKAILSTGYSLDGTVHEILDQGMLAFVPKPYQLKQLAEIVVNVLKK